MAKRAWMLLPALASVGLLAASDSAAAKKSRSSAKSAAPVRPSVGDFRPFVEFRAQDGSQLVEVARENAWAKDLYQSALWRGLSLRLSPAVSLVADPKTDRWSGRLLDFLIEKALSKRPVTVAHYLKRGLVSPFGLRVEGLADAEASALEPVLAQFRVQENVKVEIEGATGVPPVDSLAVQGQRFAARLGGGCLAIGRDPKVVAAMSMGCPGASATGAAGRLTASLGRLSPSLAQFAQRFAQLGSTASIEFDYDGAAHRYRARAMTLPASGKAGALRSENWPAELARVLPADASGFVAAFVPRPARFNNADVQRLLAEGAAAARPAASVQAVLAVIPVKGDLQTVLLLRDLSGQPVPKDELAELFSGKGDSVKFASTCGYSAISPSEPALQRLEEACSKKAPGLADQAEAIRKALAPEKAAAAAWLNLPALVASAFEKGMEKESLDAEPARKAMKTIAGLPQFAFAGEVKGDTLVMQGTQQ